MAKLGGVLPKDGDLGPTKTLLTTQKFDEVRLLSNYSAEWGKWFVAWLGVKADLVQVVLDKPTDYAALYRIANGELGRIRDRNTWSETELCLHLSPGTPQMAAVWLLLGKTRYPATFYETYGGESLVIKIPFDLTVDVIPEIFRDPDAHWQHLAAQSPSQVEGFQSIVGDSPAICEAEGGRNARRCAGSRSWCWGKAARARSCSPKRAILRGKATKSKPDFFTVWTLLKRDSFARWFDRYCREGVSGYLKSMMMTGYAFMSIPVSRTGRLAGLGDAGL